MPLLKKRRNFIKRAAERSKGIFSIASCSLLSFSISGELLKIPFKSTWDQDVTEVEDETR